MINNKNQQGAISLTYLLFLVFFSMVAKGGFNLLPVYMENRAVKSVIAGFIAEQEGVVARQDIMASLNKRLADNDISNVSSGDFRMVRKGGKHFLEVSYSSAVPYIFNIELLVKFDDIRFDITEISVR